MKIKDILLEGGNAFNDVSPIRMDELFPTLEYVAELTGIHDIKNRVLGSAGKKEFSGDVDVALEEKDPMEMVKFIWTLEDAFGKDSVRKIGKLVTTRVPIQNFHRKSSPDSDYRSKYVQIDYMFGDTEWLKFYFFSPDQNESNLKGAHRNLALASIAQFIDREESKEKDNRGYPVEVTRWMWSSRGLTKVNRVLTKSPKTGEYNKRYRDTVLEGPLFKPEEVVKVLFPNMNVDISVLDTAERIIGEVNDKFPEHIADKIFKAMAENFSNARNLKNKEWNYPPQIEKHMS